MVLDCCQPAPAERSCDGLWLRFELPRPRGCSGRIRSGVLRPFRNHLAVEAPRLEFRRGDILIDEFETASFDLVINCSAIEHVGLSGRYGVDTGIGDGDLQAMRRLADLMKPGGLMLLTIPVGRDAVFEPMTRIYGSERLPRLIDGFAVETESYWIKDDANRWFECDRETALAVETWADSPSPLENFYGIGCFRLRKPTIATDRGAGESC